jgi:hypothetical protein
MSATLTPTEQSEAVRFGIHDEDVIAEMEGHADDELQCIITEGREKCEAAATHILVCRNCNKHAACACERHAVMVATSEQPTKHATCGAVGALRDLIRVVPL